MKRSAFLSLLFLVAALLSCAGSSGESSSAEQSQPESAWHEGGRVERAELGSIVNASSFGEDIYFGGQLQPDDVALLREKGVKTVVNLRRPQEMEQLGFDEGQILQEAGMEYHHIPFGHELPPDEQAYGQLADLLDDPQKHPLLLHCASSNRVGYTWALFRAKQHDLGLSAAVNEGKSAGMRSPRFEAHLHNLLLPKPDQQDDR